MRALVCAGVSYLCARCCTSWWARLPYSRVASSTHTGEQPSRCDGRCAGPACLVWRTRRWGHGREQALRPQTHIVSTHYSLLWQGGIRGVPYNCHIGAGNKSCGTK